MSETLAKQLDKSLIDMVYPVGSIYMSVNAADPAALFGGKWERLKDVFLLAAGDTYTAGSTGGEAKHTLSVDEMPRHRHSSSSYMEGYTNGNIIQPDKYCTWLNAGTPFKNDVYNDQSGPVTTSYVGGSKSHNNMPPYLSVYMWKRTA